MLNVAGSYALTARVGSVSSSSFGVTINPAAAKTPTWQSAPDSTLTAGGTLDPIVVHVLDALGNLATNSTACVTLKLTGGKFANGASTVTVQVVDGIATFSGLSINNAGSYTLTASLGSASTSTSNLTVH